MHSCSIHIVAVLAFSAATVRAETLVERPALDGVKPVAACKLQALPERNENYMSQPVGLYTIQPTPGDPLDNYERTPLGDWRMPATVDRGDPWLRLLLLGPKRPLTIDLAVFIDGQPFRESRETWIDQLLAPANGNNADLPEGTKLTEAASEDVPASDDTDTTGEQEQTTKDTKDTKDTKEEEENRVKDETKPARLPGIPAQTRQAPTMGERLKSYLAASESTVDREEIRWLIAEWGSGPAVLLLGPSLSWQRAGLAPLLAYLDHDQDGSLSAAEIAAASDLLRRADMDANDVLDANEIRRAADRPAATPFATDHSLLVQLDAETDWDALAATYASAYGEQTSGATDTDGLRQLAERPADVTLRVDFGTKEKQATGVSIVAVSDELGEVEKVVTASSDVVTLDLGADYIEFSAAQGKADGTADVGGTQVAIGAAIDGNPLERLLDRDNDQRLTMRERQELTGLLSALDRDGDGAVGAGEMPMPIRFAVTLGPRVHQLLATPVGAARAIAPREAAPASPAWFASMDKNHDGDLSRGEFLGTTEQFRQIDTDGDGAVGAGEMPMAIRFAVTLGPRVHQLLATPVGAARAIAPREAAPASPAWFMSMDKNHDGDLSRGEFLGTTEQFRQIDADGDGLLSVAEALKLNPGQ